MVITRNVLLTALLSIGTCSAASVYAVTTNQYFGTLNLDTGAFQQIGPNLPEESFGLVPGPSGRLLSLAFSGNLLSIDPASGASHVVGASGLGDCSGPNSPCPPNSSNVLFQFGGQYYATDVANNLYTINPNTAAVTLLGTTGLPPAPFKVDMINPDGTRNVTDESMFVSGGKLYATNDAGTIDSNGNVTPVVPPALYQLDLTTLHASTIGSTGFGLFTSIDIGGTVYAYSAADLGLVTIELSTGSPTFLRAIDPAIGFIGGVTPVPEPSTLALISLTLLATVNNRRLRRLFSGKQER